MCNGLRLLNILILHNQLCKSRQKSVYAFMNYDRVSHCSPETTNHIDRTFDMNCADGLI